ncbi:hypothetical protein [Anaeromassilibacillus sp. SJQ-1]|uniref:hypothetical protein n=1 Tax=Anaeromassilibacillus sp. SJQ-1 TaxID=3375419 RepID=UPI00398994D5
MRLTLLSPVENTLSSPFNVLQFVEKSKICIKISLRILQKKPVNIAFPWKEQIEYKRGNVPKLKLAQKCPKKKRQAQNALCPAFLFREFQIESKTGLILM